MRRPTFAMGLLLAMAPAALSQTAAPAPPVVPAAVEATAPATSANPQAPTPENRDLIRGIVRAQDEAWYSSELGLPIDQLPFKEGQTFKKGELLISFDCATLDAQLKAADAKLQGESITFKNNRELKVHNAIGQYDVDLSEAKVREALAERDAIAVNIARCDIKAPFNGEVGQLNVHLHETPDRSIRMMQVLDSSSLEVDTIVPSTWLRWLKVGSRFTIAIDELGETTDGEVIRIAAAVDAVSQTVKVVGRLASDQGRIRPGMSGALIFTDQPKDEP